MPGEGSLASNQGVVFLGSKTTRALAHGHIVGLKLPQSLTTCAFTQLPALAFVFIPAIHPSPGN